MASMTSCGLRQGSYPRRVQVRRPCPLVILPKFLLIVHKTGRRNGPFQHRLAAMVFRRLHISLPSAADPTWPAPGFPPADPAGTGTPGSRRMLSADIRPCRTALQAASRKSPPLGVLLMGTSGNENQTHICDLRACENAPVVFFLQVFQNLSLPVSHPACLPGTGSPPTNRFPGSPGSSSRWTSA